MDSIMASVAIDGPSGAGKSTIARRAAGELGFVYVDTGALYRAVGLYAIKENIPIDGGEGPLAQRLDDVRLELRHTPQGQQVWLCGEDVSGEIRTPQISMAASAVSAMPAVRAYLLDLQRDMARRQSVIMDGRDIGTVVLPNADLKIFLTASAEDRARRRYEEYLANGDNVRYNEVLEDMQRRDAQDTGRSAAPLCQAPDAVRLDTTGNTLQQSVQLVLDLIRERGVGGSKQQQK